MDNASANDGCIKHMKPILDSWNTTVVGGKFLHMRCVAHILNLVVSDGLEEIGLSVRRVREAVKWIRNNPAREEAFDHTVQALKINCSKSLCMDVPTRWNSTYSMLESAQVYEEVFLCFASMNKDFRNDLNQKMYKDQPVGVLEKTDWVNVRRMIDYLVKFFDLTLLVSGTSYCTSHQFFKEMCDDFELITELEIDEDNEIRDMAGKMRLKLGKYWLETKELNPRMNKILYVAAVLDPRQKMKHVGMCLTTVYGEKRASELVVEVNNSLYELFAFYKKQMAPPPVPRANTSSSSRTVRLDRRGPRGKETCSLLQVVTDQHPDATDMSELTLYFTEKQYMMTPDEVNDFDILLWWSKHAPRFPILSEMAKDVLAIPISSVVSESAFSTGGRVLSQFRSSLTPNMVEALLCAEDWLRSSSSDIFLKDEEDVPETELEKEFENVLHTFQLDVESECPTSMSDSAQTQMTASTSQNVV